MKPIRKVIITNMIFQFLLIFALINIYSISVSNTSEILSLILISHISIGTSSYFIYRYLKPINEVKHSLKQIKNNKYCQISNDQEIWEDIIPLFNAYIHRLQVDTQEVERLEKMRSQFMANVSHEVKTPLFAIKGFAETLLDGAIDDSNVNKEFLTKILNQSARLEDLFSDLIEISRIESGDLTLQLEYFQCNEILDWVQDTFWNKCLEKGIKLSIPSVSGIEILGDKHHLKTVFSNLLNNAINYSNSGTINLLIKQKHKTVNFRIIDNGIGIDIEHQDRVFERFYRVDKARSKSIGSTGLGLAIVKHILEAHNSEIHLESSPNIGSTFSFSLAANVK